jgi:uncharacterized membrane protein
MAAFMSVTVGSRLCAAQNDPVPATPFDGTYQIYDLPNGMQAPNLTGINNLGLMCGYFYDSASSSTLGFVDDHGTVTRLVVPGSVGTWPQKPNDNGDIVGYYFRSDNTAASHGFLYSKGNFTTFDFPGAMSTIPLGINNLGVIAGTYQNPDYLAHGFLRFPDGTLQTFDDPDIVGDGAEDINDKGHITGTFYFYANGKFSPYLSRKYQWPTTRAINNKDQTVGNGTFTDNPNTLAGFFHAHGEYYSLVPPGADEIIAYDLNDSGVIVGWYLSYATGTHSFIARPNDLH